MTQSALAHLTDAAYEKFLYAPVGEDRKGSQVTVLSTLARMGIDPWQEASELTNLSEDSARKRLDILLAKFSDVPTLILDHRAIAARLISLLPNRAISRIATSQAASSDATWHGVARAVLGIPIYAIIMISLILVQVLIFSLSK